MFDEMEFKKYEEYADDIIRNWGREAPMPLKEIAELDSFVSKEKRKIEHPQSHELLDDDEVFTPPTEAVGRLILPDVTTDVSKPFDIVLITDEGEIHNLKVRPDMHEEFTYALHEDEDYVVSFWQGLVTSFAAMGATPKHKRRADIARRVMPNRDILIEVEARGTCLNIEEENGMPAFDFKVGDKTVTACISPKFDLNSIPLLINEGDEYTFKGFKNSDGYFIITDAVDYEEVLPLDEKAKKSFRRLNRAQKCELACVINSYNSGENLGYDPQKTEFHTTEDYRNKYEVLKNYLPESISSALDACLRRNEKEGKKTDCLKALLDKLYISSPLPRHTEYYMNALKERIYGREREVREFLEWLASPTGGIYAIAGETGTGKSFIVDEVCKITETKKAEISMAAISDAGALVGTPRIYENATTGSLIESVIPGGVLVLEGFDLMGKRGEDDPAYAIISMLDSGEIIDKLVQKPIPLKEIGAKVVVLLNDVKSLPKSVAKKLKVKIFTPYTPEDKINITKDFLIPREIDFSLKISDSVYEILAHRLTLDGGIFDISHNISKLARNAKEGECVTEDNIFELLEMKRWERGERAEDIQSIKEKFLYLRPFYEKSREDKILELISEFENSVDLEKKNWLLSKLVTLVNIVKGESFDDIDIDKLEADMNKTHFNMKVVKDALLNGATLRKRSSAAVKPILIAGPFGTGKTTLSRSYAESIGIPCVRLLCQDANSTLMEKIAERLALAGTSRVVLLLDEIDKMSKTDNPLFSIQSLIDGTLQANSLPCGIDVPDITLIATANDLSCIPMALISRFEIVAADGYTYSEKLKIAKEFTIPTLLSDYNAKNLSFEDEAAEMLLSYSDELGIRDAKNNATTVIAKVLRSHPEESYRVSAEDVKKALGALPLKRGNFPRGKIAPGIVKGLAVSGNSGIVTAVMVSENTYSDKDECAGLLGESTMESLKVAKYLAQNKLGRKISPLFVSLSEGAVKKEGASGGMALYAAIMSRAKNISVPEEYAFTGEVDQFGNVFPVGVSEKITAAIADGCTKVFIPRANFEVIRDGGKAHKYKECELVPIEHIDELDELFKED